MKKVAEVFSYIWKRLKNNLGLKLLSLFFAVLLWNSVITQTNPTIERQVDNIKITVLGKEELADNGLALLDDIAAYLTKVKVNIRLYRSDLVYFNESDVQVNLDLSRIYDIGPQQVKLTAYSNLGTIEKIIPESITLEVDKRSSRIIPVECKTISQVPDGYYAGRLTVSPSSIQISGPDSIIQQIEKAQLSLDLSEVKSQVAKASKFTLVDADGNAVNDSAVTMSADSALMSMDVTPKKTLIIDPNSAVTGIDRLPPGYMMSSIELFPASVEVTGPAELLNSLQSLSTEVIDIAGQSEDVETEIKIFVPQGVTLLSSDTVGALVRIDEILQEKVFEGMQVLYRNLPAGLKVQNFNFRTDLTIKAPMNRIGSISASHITLFIDLQGLTAGEHELPVAVEVSDEYGIVSTVIADPVATIELLG